MPIAFEIQQGLSCVFTNLPNLTGTEYGLPMKHFLHKLNFINVFLFFLAAGDYVPQQEVDLVGQQTMPKL